MKICMLTTTHGPFDSRIFHKEAKSLAKVHEVVLIAPDIKRFDEEVDGVKIITIQEAESKILHPLTMWRVFKAGFKQHCDVYQCHEPDSFLFTIFLKILKRKKIVYDVHESYKDMVPLLNFFGYKIFLQFMLYLFEPFFCRYAEAIITTDKEIEKIYKRFNNNVVTVFNFPSFETFKPLNNEFIRKKINNCYTIIYVGGITEERGIFELIKAVHKVSYVHPLVKLLLIGNFKSKNFKYDCIEYVRLNNLNEIVEFLGVVPHKDIPKYICAADLGAVLLKPVPKFYKNIPIKQFEYMICGKPVLGSNLPPIENFVGKEKAGILVNPNDINEIAEAIIYLIKHPEEAESMGENGRKAIEEKYNWGEMEKKILKVYSEIGD